MKLRLLLPLVALLTACVPPQPPAPTQGVIQGTVSLDGSSAGAQGIEVSLKGLTYRTTTDAAGTYRLADLPVGAYYVRAAKAGYGTKQTAAVVNAGSTTTAATLNLPLLPVTDTVAVDPSDTDGSQSWGYSDASTAERRATVSYTVPSGGADVFYLLTNTSTSGYTSLAGAGPVAASAKKPVRRELQGLGTSAAAAYRKALRNPARALGGSPAPGIYTVGSTTTFTDALWDWPGPPSAANLHASTLRNKTVRGGHSLHIWVADGAWDGDSNGTPAVPRQGLTHGVNQTMVDALASRFLHAGDEDDIYSWVTKLYGQEWPASGTPLGGTLIQGGGQIHIFLANLNPQGTNNGVLMGYFHALNNIVGETGSNGKVLFALNADTLAKSTGTSWEISDYWPAETVSTLAHEFQHMIHFYQKQVVHNKLDTETDVWINEMASLVTEDLVADKLGVPGPRGRIALDAGSAGILEGWLPTFNYYHEVVPLTTWGSYDLLASYANSYVFGAWLLRNYGGPELFHDIVTSAKTDFNAVLDAVNTYRSAHSLADATYASLVSDWGLAVFLGTSGQRAGLNYQDGSDGFLWNYAGLDYQAGSLDPWNYRYEYLEGQWLDGPWVYGAGSFNSQLDVGGGATSFHWLGRQDAGDVVQDVTLPANITLSVVVKP